MVKCNKTKASSNCKLWRIFLYHQSPDYRLHGTENYIFFFQTSWKDGLSKKIALEYNLSCIIRKDDISYPQTENERWSFSKNKYTEIRYFLRMFWKDGLFKKDRAGTWYFLHYLEWWYFFPDIMVLFPWTESEKGMTFLKKYTETWCFLFEIFHAPLRKKKSKTILSRKIHLKVIDIPGQHPRKSSSSSLCLHGDFYRRFHILLSSKKNMKLNVLDWSVTFS